MGRAEEFLHPHLTMAVQVAGLASGFNWQNIINELIQADSAGVDQVKTQQTTVNSQVSALGTLSTDLTSLQSSIYSLESPGLYNAVTASSATTGSTWSLDAAAGTPTGSYAIDVQQLATNSVLKGVAGVSQGLSPTSDVDNLTIANVPTAQPITAGTFTVNGQPVTVTTTETLQDVFTAISNATDGHVTAQYNPASSSTDPDTVTLTSDDGPILLGAANDTSNFLTQMQLQSQPVSLTDTDSITSLAPLGALQLDTSIANSGLKATLSGQDSKGNGILNINGVAIDYNVNTGTLSTLIGTINNSGAGVTASYDTVDNRMVLTNSTTGDLSISVSDSEGNLAQALGLTSGAGATLTLGVNAQYSVDDGPAQTSDSNTLTPVDLGITGLTLTANTTGTQTIQVTTDTTALSSAITAFINDFNQYQSDTAKDTLIGQNSSSGAVTTSLLSADHEVGDWASSLQMTVFGAGSSLSGSIKSLDDLGIDFNGTTGQLTITDSSQLQEALSSNTAGVAAFFQTAKTGFGSIVNASVIDTEGEMTTEKTNLQDESADLGTQITAMQTQLSAEQSQMEAEFEAMETAESQYQSELSALGSLTGSSGSSSSSSSTSNNPSNSDIYVNGVENNGSSSSTSSGTSGTSSG